MPKIEDVARIKEDKNLTRELATTKHKAVSIAVVQAYIDQEPGRTSSQLAKHFYPDRDWATAQTYMGAKLKRWADKKKLVRRRYNGVYHYYPHNFIVPGDPKMPGDVTKSYLCPEANCGQKFKTVNARAAHQRIHRHDRPSAVQQIIDYLRDHPGARYTEIVAATGLPSGTVGSGLTRIKAQGGLTSRGGNHYLEEQPQTAPAPTGLPELAKEYIWENSYLSQDLPAIKRFTEWVEKKRGQK